MPHDNVKACEDVFGKLQDNHMMSPTLIQINRTSPWSPCSAAIITEFLDSGHGEFHLFTIPVFDHRQPGAPAKPDKLNRQLLNVGK